MSKKEELQKALDEIYNDYNTNDLFNINSNSNTHQHQFDLLSQLKGDKVERAINWIKHNYDSYYNGVYIDKESACAFDNLQKCIDKIIE